MSDSTRRTSRGKVPRPRKPRPDFPLSIHKGTGYWCKKIRGRARYFGKVADDPEGQRALEQWLDQKDDLLAGRTPRVSGDGLTVAALANRFLTFKQALVSSGELQRATWHEYHLVCETVVRQFGRNRLVTDLASDDFEALRATFAKAAGPVRLSKLVQITRCLFKYGFDAGLVAQPTRYGPGFRRPTKAVLRRHRAKQGPRLFSPAEIHALLKKANPTMQAFILLAANAALGNADVARMESRHLDLTLADGWGVLDYPRGKTGIARKAYLWPETRQAIEAAIGNRQKPADAKHRDRVFLTASGGSWQKETSDNPVAKEFAKLVKAAGIKRRGASFYDLRHTARTVMDETRDFPAIDLVMGHARDDMASVYRERIGDDRLQAVVEHVRGWLFSESADQADEFPDVVPFVSKKIG